MGFIRSTQRKSLSKAEIVTLAHFAVEHEIATLLREADPFRCEDPCPQNKAGHNPIICANELVCEHCSKVFWPSGATVYRR